VGEGDASQIAVGEALAEYVVHERLKADTVIAVAAVVVAEHLFIDVAEKVERFHGDVRSC